MLSSTCPPISPDAPPVDSRAYSCRRVSTIPGRKMKGVISGASAAMPACTLNAATVLATAPYPAWRHCAAASLQGRSAAGVQDEAGAPGREHGRKGPADAVGRPREDDSTVTKKEHDTPPWRKRIWLLPVVFGKTRRPMVEGARTDPVL